MMRLLDLHALSCAGDTLIAIGLAGTIFFAAPAGEARGRVALYLLVTMVPFAVLAPLIGPVLDRFRHGRRLALAATMIGRAFLAWVIADNLFGFGLYPAAFGVLALSRAYGVARSAAVPRLLPDGLGLSQATARGSVYGTVAGVIVAPLGAAAFWFGPQWPLRVASVIFLAGSFIAISLPPKADSDAPETLPKIFQIPWRHRSDTGERILAGRLVRSALAGSAGMRALYGFLLLFLAFAIREHTVPTAFLAMHLSPAGAIGLVGAALVLGTFLATAIGSGVRLQRPIRVQAIGFGIMTAVGILATVRFTLATVVVFCLAAAIASGLAKLAVDATIQERIPETVRASAFAHSETLLMLAWVGGGAIGLIPLEGRVGVALATVAALAAALHGAVLGWRMRADVLRGRSTGSGGRAVRPLGHPAGRPVLTASRPRRAAGGASAQAPRGPGPVDTTLELPLPPNGAEATDTTAELPERASTTDATETGPPGFHIFRPSPRDGDAPRPGTSLPGTPRPGTPRPGAPS